jgi:hypothetical protein
LSENKLDFSTLTDYEISMLIIERNTCHYKIEQIEELLKKIEEAKGFSGDEKASPAASNKGESRQLPGTDFDKLPWMSYKTKQAAGPNEAAWIFYNTEGAEALRATIKANNGYSKIGNFEYQRQGPEGKFIARKPVK